MRSTTFVLLTAAVLLATVANTQTAADDDIGLCCLCNDCFFPPSGRGDFFVNQDGLTCNELALEMADPENASTRGSGACRRLQRSFRQICCDASFDPPQVAQAPTPAPVINLPYGNEPVCNVCHDAAFPGLPKTVTAVLYIDGNPTCEQLYYMGLYGLILDRLCNPLQDYLAQGCGCGEFNPNYEGGTESPTATPVETTQQQPVETGTPLPTLPPTSEPTNLPAVQPTMKPTVEPTAFPTVIPTSSPSMFPTTARPTRVPTVRPTVQPSMQPTTKPTVKPMLSPTGVPTASAPTSSPSNVPTTAPTKQPTASPVTTPLVRLTTPPTTPSSSSSASAPIDVAEIVLTKKTPSPRSSKDDNRYKLGGGGGRIRGGSKRV